MESESMMRVVRDLVERARVQCAGDPAEAFVALTRAIVELAMDHAKPGRGHLVAVINSALVTLTVARDAAAKYDEENRPSLLGRQGTRLGQREDPLGLGTRCADDHRPDHRQEARDASARTPGSKEKRMTQLLTETADYDEPGSWGRASEGWPDIKGDQAYDMFVFANCAPSIPYGSYVLMGRRGEHGAVESCLRVHPDYTDRLHDDFASAGKPEPEESIRRRGAARRAAKWW